MKKRMTGEERSREPGALEHGRRRKKCARQKEMRISRRIVERVIAMRERKRLTQNRGRLGSTGKSRRQSRRIGGRSYHVSFRFVTRDSGIGVTAPMMVKSWMSVLIQGSETIVGVEGHRKDGSC